MRHITTTIRMISVCVLVLAVASPAWGQIVADGLIGAHDAGLYTGGNWTDANTGDGYDSTGTLGSLITWVAPAGGEPGYFTGFSNTADGDNTGAITFDVNTGTTVGTGDFTYSMWINKIDPGAGQLGLGSSHAGFVGGGGFSIFQVAAGDTTSGGALRASVAPGSVDSGNAFNANDGSPVDCAGNCMNAFPGAANLFDGTWHLFTLTRSGPLNDDYNIYFDDDDVTIVLGTPGTNVEADLGGGTSPLNINAHNVSGRILGPNDKVNKTLFYNRALSPAEITQNVAAGPTAVVGPASPPPLDAIWTTNGIGLWNDFENWSIFSAPTTVRHTATFGAAIDNPTTVVVDTAVSINAITFDHSVSYGIAGRASVNLGANTAEPPRQPRVTVAQGDHEFQVVANLLDDATADVASGSTLTFNNVLNLMGKTLTKTGAGELAINNNLLTAGGTLNCSEGTCSGTGTFGGDLNNDGGTISPGNSAGLVGNQVPEPSTLTLLLLGGLLGFWAGRRSPTK